MIVSRILEDVNFKYYIEYLMGSKIDKIINSNVEQEEKMLFVMVDVMAFIIQKINNAEENIDLLVMSYKNMTQDQVDDMDCDEFIDTLKTIFMAGVPKVLNDYVDLTEFKKKMDQLKKEPKKNIQKENN